jgi:hypothetical protein
MASGYPLANKAPLNKGTEIEFDSNGGVWVFGTLAAPPQHGFSEADRLPQECLWRFLFDDVVA